MPQPCGVFGGRRFYWFYCPPTKGDSRGAERQAGGRAGRNVSLWPGQPATWLALSPFARGTLPRVTIFGGLFAHIQSWLTATNASGRPVAAPSPRAKSIAAFFAKMPCRTPNCLATAVTVVARWRPSRKPIETHLRNRTISIISSAVFRQ